MALWEIFDHGSAYIVAVTISFPYTRLVALSKVGVAVQLVVHTEM